MGEVEIGSTSLSSVSSRVVPVLDEEENQQQRFSNDFGPSINNNIPIRNININNNSSSSSGTETTIIEVQQLSSKLENNSSEMEMEMEMEQMQVNNNIQDDFLPITKSRTGNTFTVAFHSLCSGIGIQTLLLPVAFISLGWYVCMGID